ncbi:tRNA (adenosine(37)-N6)-dimethylallyltransferase MiaA [soil metagenome]
MIKKVIVIAGPTASGKSNLAVNLALKLNGEVISADSRQVYKRIPIATAIPTLAERQGIPHHFLEILNLNETYTAGEFGRQGRAAIEDIFSHGKQPIVAGGSGLYIRSLIDGLFEEEIKDEKIRKDLYDKLKDKGKEFIYNELVEIDKIAASTMLPQNIRRVIRALEVYYSSGKKISELQKQKINIDFKSIQFGLFNERSKLYDKINARVDRMFQKGLMDEVEWLRDNGYNWHEYNSLNTVGVKEVMGYLDGELKREQMFDMIKQNTRRYAKRQITWFGADKRINWIEIDDTFSENQITNEVIKIFHGRTVDS